MRIFIPKQRQPQLERIIVQIRQGPEKLSWDQIVKKVHVYEQYKSLTRSQCRRRYLKYLQRLNITNQQVCWTPQQNMKLCMLYIDKGPDWTVISKNMKNRSTEIIKNKINSSLMMVLQKLNRKIQGKIYKIKYNCFKRFLVITDPRYQSKMQQKQKTKFQMVRNSLIKCALLSQNYQCSEQQSKQIIDSLHEFNRNFRHLNMRNNSYIRSCLVNKILKSSKYSKQSNNSFEQYGEAQWVKKQGEQMFIDNANKSEQKQQSELRVKSQEEKLNYNDIKLQHVKVQQRLSQIQRSTQFDPNQQALPYNLPYYSPFYPELYPPFFIAPWNIENIAKIQHNHFNSEYP